MFEAEVLRRDAAVSGLIDPHELQRRVALHRSGASDESYALWAVWMLERWMREK
jgi:hypothetical protein